MFRHNEEKLNRAVDRAFEKKETKEVGRWLKAWAKEDRKDQKHWEEELRKKYHD